MSPLDEARARARNTYNAAADAYDDPANAFWARFGRATVERMGLARGDRVLDACCGTGASALPAAERVGPGGFVLGVDLAERLLELARRKANARAFAHCQFRNADILDPYLGTPGPEVPQFDAVVCVFGIFFVPDVAAAVRALWQHVRPGGRLAITTWGPRFLEPANTAFWESIRNERPDLYRGFHPWDRITQPDALRAVMRDGGVADADIAAVAGEHPIGTPQAWWWAVLGTGYRGTVEQLDAAARHRVMSYNLEFVRRAGVRSVEVNVVYANATKPAR